MYANRPFFFRILACFALICSSASIAEPIKIGAVVPLNEDAGKQSANAMKLAIKEINKAGGVLGRPLTLIIEDDGMNAEKGTAAVEKLGSIDKVDFFVGGLSSGVHLAQIPILKKFNKITIWSGAASYRVERALKDVDWYFHLHPWDYQQAQSYVDGWQAIGKKYPRVKVQKWFFAYEDGAFGTSTYKANTEVFPADWSHKGADFKSAAVGGGGDYRIVLKRAKEYQPDIFMWVGYEADALLIMNQAKETGYTPPIFAGSPPGWPPYFARSKISEGVTLYGMWAPSLAKVNRASRDFSAAYKAEYSEEPDNYMAPLNYSSIYIAAEAIKKAGSLDTAALIAALQKTSYESPLGETISFTPSKIVKHQGLRGQKIMQWQNGVQHIIWPFEYATTTFRYPFKPSNGAK